VAAETRFIASQNWSHLLYFTLIGFLIFLVPAMMNLSREALTGYVLAVLYLMGPLAGVMTSVSVFGRPTSPWKR